VGSTASLAVRTPPREYAQRVFETAGQRFSKTNRKREWYMRIPFWAEAFHSRPDKESRPIPELSAQERLPAVGKRRPCVEDFRSVPTVNNDDVKDGRFPQADLPFEWWVALVRPSFAMAHSMRGRAQNMPSAR